jgi:hypothetical protein
MDSLIDLTSANWSYYTVRIFLPRDVAKRMLRREPEPRLIHVPQIPVAFVLCMVPHGYAISLAGKNYDVGK